MFSHLLHFFHKRFVKENKNIFLTKIIGIEISVTSLVILRKYSLALFRYGFTC